MGKVSDVQRLDAFEKNAYISGLIGDVQKLSAETSEEDTDKAEIAKRIEGKLNTAIRVAELLIGEETDLAQQLRPATLYNLAICLHEKGKSLDAVVALMKLAKEYPKSDRARRASGLACSIAYKLIGSANEASLANARALFVAAAQAMLAMHPDDADSARWRIPLGHVLTRTGEHAAAAKVYQDISPGDERYLDARFLQLQARRKALDLDGDHAGQREFKAAYALVQEAIRYAEQARAARDESNDAQRRRMLNEYAIGSELLAADLEVSPCRWGVGQSIATGCSVKGKQRTVPGDIGSCPSGANSGVAKFGGVGSGVILGGKIPDRRFRSGRCRRARIDPIDPKGNRRGSPERQKRGRQGPRR